MPQTLGQAFVGHSRPDATTRLHHRIIVLGTYLVGLIVAVLAITAALPPIVGDETDRAVLDAPVTFLTTPISGEVAGVTPAAHADGGGPLNVLVHNTRVDRTTLMNFESKIADLENRHAVSLAREAADRRYVAALDGDIAGQKDQLAKEYETRADALRNQVQSAQANVDEKQALHERQVTLMQRAVISKDMMKPMNTQVSGAAALKAAAEAQLAGTSTALHGIERNVFAGDGMIGIETLVQKRRDVAFDADKERINARQTEVELAEAKRLVAEERARLASLTIANLAAQRDLDVLHVGVAPGRHVNAGDALATMVNCKTLFAVAIFSYRQASDLTVGTRMTISGPGMDQPIGGTVQNIIPKSDNKTDELYAVAFPQTERREMYVIVQPDDVNALRPHNGVQGAGGACPVGEWVTVARDGGWVPSSSILWHRLSRTVASLVFPTRAEAEGRPTLPRRQR